MKYKWEVTKLQVAEDNLIVKVDFMVTGTDGDNSASAAYSRNLVRSDSFISFNQLLEQQVLDWCFAPEFIVLNEQTITRLIKDEGEAQVANQIARRLAQKAAEPGLPWAEVAQPA